MLICNLCYFRKIKGLTQSELGEKLGVTKNSISNLELGKFYPSALLIYKILHYFNIEFDDLFYYQEVLST